MSQAIAVIQARMTSTRLAGKSLLPLAGRPMLAHVIERVQAIPGIGDVWVATTDDGSEEPLVELGARMGARCYRGDTDDVLSRYAAITELTNAGTIMRITADCPLLDPGVSGGVLGLYQQASPACDYASNTLRRTYPRGLDTEVFSAAALREAHAEASEPADREHVTRFLYRHPDRYRIRQLEHPVDRSGLRWTVDTEADYHFVSEVHAELAARGLGMTIDSTLSVLAARPELTAINAHVNQKPA